jgi:hypothetical protein
MALESCEGGELFDQIVRVSLNLLDRNVVRSWCVFASDVLNPVAERPAS